MYTDNTFRPIKGFPGYAISEAGEVISFKRGRGKILKPFFDGDGYQGVKLFRDNIGHYQKIHWLVAQTFLGPRPEGCDIDHIDGDKTNNHYTNLRYVTHKENMYNPNTLPRHISRRAARGVIATTDGVEQHFDSVKGMCRELGLDHGTVCNCLAHKPSYHTHHGYTFRYKEAQ